jgi:multiple sugar transport system ATP-binding protein
MAEVRLEHLTRRLPAGTLVVDDVSLTIADGEFLVLAGPAGSGKSTVLRMIAGLEDIISGDIYLNGKPVTGLPPDERDIPIVYRNHALDPLMTVAENLGFARRTRKATKERARQPVAVGTGFVRQPRVVLLDEPLSGLGAKLQVPMRGELSRLHRQYGTTILYVTRDQAEAMALGDRIAVLNQGRIQQVGTPGELYYAPANRFVAGFVGSPGMNFAIVRVRAGDPITLDLAGYIWPLPAALNRWPDLARYVDGTVLLGLRPDAFSVTKSIGRGAKLQVAPLKVESVGDEKHVLFVPPGRDLAASRSPLALDESEAVRMWTAKAGARVDLATGREVDFTVDLTAAYFFDPDTGAAIPTGSAHGSDAATVIGSRVGRRSAVMPVEPDAAHRYSTSTAPVA